MKYLNYITHKYIEELKDYYYLNCMIYGFDNHVKYVDYSYIPINKSILKEINGKILRTYISNEQIKKKILVQLHELLILYDLEDYYIFYYPLKTWYHKGIFLIIEKHFDKISFRRDIAYLKDIKIQNALVSDVNLIQLSEKYHKHMYYLLREIKLDSKILKKRETIFQLSTERRFLLSIEDQALTLDWKGRSRNELFKIIKEHNLGNNKEIGFLNLNAGYIANSIMRLRKYRKKRNRNIKKALDIE